MEGGQGGKGAMSKKRSNLASALFCFDPRYMSSRYLDVSLSESECASVTVSETRLAVSGSLIAHTDTDTDTLTHTHTHTHKQTHTQGVCLVYV
jgi:hypothetical protein